MEYTDNLIPIMTSNNTPSGIASASSSFYSPSYDAFHAFDGDKSNNNYKQWFSNNVPTVSNKQWLCYKFPSKQKIDEYTIVINFVSNMIDASPNSWTFEGSNDNTTWDILDTQINITNWDMGIIKEFPFNNSVSYLYYRININKNNGNSQYVCIAEMEMKSLRNRYLVKQNDQYYTLKLDGTL